MSQQSRTEMLIFVFPFFISIIPVQPNVKSDSTQIKILISICNEINGFVPLLWTDQDKQLLSDIQHKAFSANSCHLYAGK